MPGDFNSKCRTCLNESNTYHQLFDYVEENYKILDMLDGVVPQIDIKTPSKFSSLMCLSCVNTLLTSYKFQQLCIDTNNRLYDSLSFTIFETEPEKVLNPLTGETRPRVKQEIVEEDSYQCGKSQNDLERERELNSGREAERSTEHPKCKTFVLDNKEEMNEAIEIEVTPLIFEKYMDNVDEDSEYSNNDCGDSDYSERKMFNRPKHTENVDFVDTGMSREVKNSCNNTRKRNFKCETCSKVFTNSYRLNRHTSSVHSLDRSHECEVCKYRFATASILKGHMIQHKGLKCPDCSKSFSKKTLFAAHRLTHNRNPLNANYSIDSEVEDHKCDQCDKTFVSHIHLVEHCKSHNQNGTVCFICKKDFIYNCKLKQHMRTHSGEKPYLCLQCGKTFRNPSNLRQHTERHMGLQKYQCSECPKRFNCRTDLVKHLRSKKHSKQDGAYNENGPYKLNGKFVAVYEVNDDEEEVVGCEKAKKLSFKCPDCPRYFEKLAWLTTHYKMHTKRRNLYINTKCNKDESAAQDVYEANSLDIKQESPPDELESAKKQSKTAAQRQKEYRERQKQKNI